MQKRTERFLGHILASIEEMEWYLKGVDKRSFMQNREKQDAVIRRLEIIGEATRNLPAAFRTRHPHVPWQKVAGMRDVLIHQYFGVDLNVVWDTVTSDIPKLRQEVEQILREDVIMD